MLRVYHPDWRMVPVEPETFFVNSFCGSRSGGTLVHQIRLRLEGTWQWGIIGCRRDAGTPADEEIIDVNDNLKSKHTRTIVHFKLRGCPCSFYNTTTLPDSVVLQIIRFAARGLTVGRVHIECKQAGAYAGTGGRAYDGIPGMATRALSTSARRLVVVRLFRELRPGDNPFSPRRGAINLEHFVAVMAHELRHIHHFIKPSSRVYRGRMRNREEDARRHEQAVLKRFKAEFMHDE